MIIKKLNILSFGKLKEKEINFSDSLNVVYGTNESGKSTVSSFIEAMLYSYPPRDVSRKKYIPWGESFSQGSMTVSHDGEDVTIYRKLTASSTKDVTQISPQCDISSFIPLDRESYRKSVYCMEGKASDFGRTAEIDMRIANLMSTGDENINAEKAILKIEEYRKTLKPKKGNGGKLKEIENTITDLENQLGTLKSLSSDFLHYNKKLEDLNCALDTLTKKRDMLTASCDDKDAACLKKLDEEVKAQEKYINSFPKDEVCFPPFSFPTAFLILYILCTLAFVIIGFTLNPLFYFGALCPIVSGLVHHVTAKNKYNSRIYALLSSVGCTCIEEYEALKKDKAEAMEYYEKLIQKREDCEKSLLSKDIRTKDEINFLSSQMLEITNAIISLKNLIPPAPPLSEDEVTEKLSLLRKERDEILSDIEALDKAIEGINFARENLSKTLTPRVNETAMEYLNLIAPKKGRNISLSEDLSLFLTDPMPQEISSCSFGFKEELHLCFRIALSEYLYGNTFPLVFDDPFLGSDDYREKALIDLFLKLSEKRQIIIFTNRKNAYYNQIPCNFIDMNGVFDV